MKSYPRNPRTLTKRRATELESSLARLGDLGGIVHNLTDDTIVGGNQRMRIFGERTDTVIVAQNDEPDQQGTVAHGFIVWGGNRYAYRQVRWDEATAREANIRANLQAGEWDWQELAAWDAGELQAWGFDDERLREWGSDFSNLKEMSEARKVVAEDDDAVDGMIDKAAELQEKWQVQRGDVWAIGRHRLMCGDSTDAGDVARLMQGEKARLVFTDPPYGVDYDGGTKVREKLDGDTTTDLYMPCCAMAFKFSDEHAALYLWHAGIKGIAAAAAAAAAAAGYEIRCEIVWNKNQAQFGALSAQYKQKHEPCYYCYKRGNVARWFGATNEVTVWDVDRASVNEFHPTQKPPELAARAIGNSSGANDIVLDLFNGSGSTLVACEQTGRIGRGVEIEPKYVAVSLERLTALGLTAKRLDT